MSEAFVKHSIAGITPENPRAVAGGNRPPFLDFMREQNDDLPAFLEAESADLLKRYDELLAAFERSPKVVDSDEVNSLMTDFVNKKLSSCKSALGGLQKLHKEPYLTGGRVVDAFYKRRQDRLAEIMETCRVRQTEWNTKEEARKRREREELERVAREKALEAERIAAEERRKAAEIAAEQERVATEERRAREAAEAEARRLADEAAAAIQNEKDLQRALELEAAEKKRAAERAEQLRLEEAARAARQAEADAAARTAAEAAERRQAEADAAARAAAAKSTDLTRTRGDQGGVSSLRTEWKSETADQGILDLEALRSHLTKAACDDAIDSWVKKNAPNPNSQLPPPVLRGAKIWRHKFTR